MTAPRIYQVAVVSSCPALSLLLCQQAGGKACAAIVLTGAAAGPQRTIISGFRLVSCFRTCSLCSRRAVVEKARVAILDAMASAAGSGNVDGEFG